MWHLVVPKLAHEVDTSLSRYLSYAFYKSGAGDDSDFKITIKSSGVPNKRGKAAVAPEPQAVHVAVPSMPMQMPMQAAMPAQGAIQSTRARRRVSSTQRLFESLCR